MFTLCALYCAQGIPWGFMAITLPAYLAQRNLDAAAIGAALAMTTLPYTFKPIWGPIIDALPRRRFGKRRPWIVLAQGMMALTVGAMIAIPDLTASVDVLTWMIFIHTVFNSMQDVAVDALAVDLLNEAERGRANGLMYASKYAGGVLGGAGMTTLIGAFGLRPALAVQTAVLLAIMMLPLLVRERPSDSGEPAPHVPRARWLHGRSIITVVGAALGRFFRTHLPRVATDPAWRAAAIGGVLVIAINIASGVMTALSPILFVQHLDWNVTDYVQLTGGPGLVVGLLGSVLGGFLADKVGHRRLAAIASIALAASWLVWAALAAWWTDHRLVFALFAIEPLCQSVMTVAVFALCMDISWPRIAATQFAGYMALLNVSTTIGFRLAGHIEQWDFRNIYIAVAVLQIAITAILAFVDPHARRRAESA